VTIGALVVHVAARAGVVRRSLRPPPAQSPAQSVPVPDEGTRVSRRGLIGWSFTTAAGVALVTAGQTVPLLRRAVLLAPRRPDIGLQGVPVNQTAAEAGVVELIGERAWRLVIEVDGAERASFGLDELRAMPQRTAVLPIACVEGWSRSATWSGVPLRDLLGIVGLATTRPVEVRSLQPRGLYRTSTVEPQVWRDADTLLALRINGEELHPDHGYPVRLIAPNRPGVMQTKWLTRVVA
jgi:DMSO/TMAO reductase YedYZ molybdopterin-dependent catalytic subunit